MDDHTARTLHSAPLIPLKEAHHRLPWLTIRRLRLMIDRGDLYAVQVGAGRGYTHVPKTEVARLQRDRIRALQPGGDDA